jgi:hypothetical protein
MVALVLVWAQLPEAVVVVLVARRATAVPAHPMPVAVLVELLVRPAE